MSVFSEDLAELRQMEKNIQKDLDYGIMSVNALFGQYIDVRKLADTTKANYVRMWDIPINL